METSAILLHDVASDYVLERLVQLGQMIKAVLHNVGGPLVYLRLLICITANCILYGVLDDCADL